MVSLLRAEAIEPVPPVYRSTGVVLPFAQNSLDLLKARPVFNARGREAVEAHLRSAYGVAEVDFLGDGPVRAASGKVALAGAGLCFSRYDAATSVAFPAFGGLRQVICLTGAGRIRTRDGEVDTTPQVSCILPPDTPFTTEYSEGYQHLVLQFDPDGLAMKIKAATGMAPAGALELPFMSPLSTERQWRLKSLALTLAGLFSEDIPAGDLAANELSQALAAAFLQENLAGFAEQASGRVAAAGRREGDLLEDYIDSHWNEPLTIEDIAEACGVSVRSVYARFKQRRGQSPSEYLREVRLSNARSLLMSPTGGSVIDVAIQCGFASIGHFARRYREKFNELPSATLGRRAR